VAAAKGQIKAQKPKRTEIRPKDESKLIEEPNRRPEDNVEEIRSLLNNFNTESTRVKAREWELEHKIHQEMRERMITHEPSAIKSSTSGLWNVESAFRV
jgi:hypothetical protein